MIWNHQKKRQERVNIELVPIFQYVPAPEVVIDVQPTVEEEEIEKTRSQLGEREWLRLCRSFARSRKVRAERPLSLNEMLTDLERFYVAEGRSESRSARRSTGRQRGYGRAS